MDPNTFRPRAECLEDRLTPASPADVFGALQRTGLFHNALGYVAARAASPAGKPFQGITSAIAQQSAADFATLAEFFAALQSQIVTNPALAGNLLPFLGGVGAAEFQAQVNQANAGVLVNTLAALPAVSAANTTGTLGTTGTTGTAGTTNISTVNSGLTSTATGTTPVGSSLSTTAGGTALGATSETTGTARTGETATIGSGGTGATTASTTTGPTGTTSTFTTGTNTTTATTTNTR